MLVQNFGEMTDFSRSVTEKISILLELRDITFTTDHVCKLFQINIYVSRNPYLFEESGRQFLVNIKSRL